MSAVPFVNLALEARDDEEVLLKKFREVLRSGYYILGPELRECEKNFAELCGTKHAIGVSNGTAALYLVLRAIGIKPGDEVITAPNSFIASANAIVLAGAKPIFADIRPDLNIDPELLAQAITPRTKAIMPVHLTGRIAEMEEVNKVAQAAGIPVIEDAAQAIGALRHGRRAGSWGLAAGFSLHPLKVVHAYGDGGMITTDDDDLAERLQAERNFGFKNRDECTFWGSNDRLDELQAGLLNARWDRLDNYTAVRRSIAAKYTEELQGCCDLPTDQEYESPAYQTYVIQLEQRDELQKFLLSHGIETKVHYPIPIHQQEAAKEWNSGDFPVCESVGKRILSLPIYYGLSVEQQDEVISRVKEFFERGMA